MKYHCPIEYNISKSTNSDVCRCNHLKQNKTGNKLAQRKTLIGQYRVYNIFSLHNITLQIPIVNKSSILDVSKVFQIRFCFIYILNKKAKRLSMKIRLMPNN